MKRLLCLTLGILLILCGCAGEEEPAAAAPGGLGAAATDAARDDAIDLAAAPTAQGGETTVYGRVDSIVGNEVVLELGTVRGGMGSRNRDAAASPAAEASTDAAGGALGGDGWAPPSDMEGESGTGRTRPEGFRGTPSEGVGGASAGGGERPAMGEGNAPPGAGRSGSAGSGTGSGAQALDITYTGEKATYLLPVGMQIGTGDFSSVTAGMVLRITLNETGVITAVSIVSR